MPPAKCPKDAGILVPWMSFQFQEFVANVHDEQRSSVGLDDVHRINMFVNLTRGIFYSRIMSK